MLNGFRVAQQIAEGDAAVRRLRAGNAKRGERRPAWIIAEHEHDVGGIERRADAQPIHHPCIFCRAVIVRLTGVPRLGHGVASYTKYFSLESRPTRSASSLVGKGPSTTR